MKKYPMIKMECLHRAKGMYDGLKNIDQMIERLGHEIAYLEELQELEVEMAPSEDDYVFFSKDVVEGSKEFIELNEGGFEKIKFDENGERIDD